MTLHIPELLLTILFYLLTGTLTLLVLSCAWYFSVVRLITCMKNRRVFRMARIWLTFESTGNDAVEYNWTLWRQIMEGMAEHNPERFARYVQEMDWKVKELETSELPPEA